MMRTQEVSDTCVRNSLLSWAQLSMYTDDRYHGNAASRDPSVQWHRNRYSMKLKSASINGPREDSEDYWLWKNFYTVRGRFGYIRAGKIRRRQQHSVLVRYSIPFHSGQQCRHIFDRRSCSFTCRLPPSVSRSLKRLINKCRTAMFTNYEPPAAMLLLKIRYK